MNLLIDTHLNDIVLVLSENKKIIKIEKVLGERQNSKYIMPLIKKILDDKIPSSISVVNGPGSFTGVRLGVTIAKSLAYTMKLPIKTISSLECLAVSNEIEEKIVGFSDKNGYYVGTFDSNNNIIGCYEYISNSEMKTYLNNHNVFTDIEVNYEKVLAFLELKKEINPHEVNPFYIKKIDVEK